MSDPTAGAAPSTRAAAGRGAALVGAPFAVGAVGCALYLWHTPQVGDLAVQTTWAQLVHRVGVVPYFAGWYGGVHVGGYSLVTPPVMAAVGVRTLGVVATLATALLAALLLRSARHPRLGAVGFALAALMDLYSGRVTFAAGAAVALAAVLAAERSRPLLAALLAVLAALTSPVAGLFLGLPALVLVVCDRRRRRAGLALGLSAVLTDLPVAAAFPSGGYEPFARFAMRPALAIPLAAALLPVGRRVRIGLVLAAATVLAAYLVHSPLGSNASRLSILVVVPVVLAAMRGPLPVTVVVAGLLAVWPWHQLHDDLVAARDASARPAFVAGLTARLAGDPLARVQRVEIVDPRTHWAEARLVAHHVTMARGWVRQVDERDNPQFYGRAPLTEQTYRAFLDRQAVAFVALPHGVPIDFGSAAEAVLVAGGLPYLSPVWTDAHWTLYAVASPAPVAIGAAHVTSLEDTGVQLAAASAGSVRLALRWSPYLVADGAEVARDGDWVLVRIPAAGHYRVHAEWRWP